MSLKTLVNTPEVWQAFLEELDRELASVHKRMEQDSEAENLYRLQGQAAAYHNMKRLRDRVNAR